MSAPRYCRECQTMLLGDREPALGICGWCSTPVELRRPRRPLKKRLAYVCRACGKTEVQGRRGRPREFCPPCMTSTARLHRRQAKQAAA